LKRITRKTFLIAWLISLFFWHMPTIWILSHFENAKQDMSSLKQQAVFVNLPPAQTGGFIPLVDQPAPDVQKRPDNPSAIGIHDVTVDGEETVAARQGAPAVPASGSPSVSGEASEVREKESEKTGEMAPEKSESDKTAPSQEEKADQDQKSDSKEVLPKEMEVDPEPTPIEEKKPRVVSGKSSSQKPVEKPAEKEPEPQDLKSRLEALRSKTQRDEEKALEKFGNGKEIDFSRLSPSPGREGGEGSFLPGYKIGNKTYINAQANPDVQYFVELKRKFGLTWSPSLAVRGLGSDLAGKSTLTVALGFTIDKTGRLTEVFTIRSSDVGPYDQEAYRTVKANAPFTRPPLHLVDEEGNLHVSWHFILYLR
jgi:TonB family protein